MKFFTTAFIAAAAVATVIAHPQPIQDQHLQRRLVAGVAGAYAGYKLAGSVAEKQELGKFKTGLAKATGAIGGYIGAEKLADHFKKEDDKQ
ncbi:hypothetical protein IWQ60_007557 [Tieghemiomyces parasiticus]|uniref:Uncharacterized protein n=1 Tax=Tieghemiomyces parasiticus TaxID=78921 RepID=A0A9W8DNR4_9FUNG|nr:hypothetical protein IWQ60_007557 [Tieghemiomyces parasiticus]